MPKIPAGFVPFGKKVAKTGAASITPSQMKKGIEQDKAEDKAEAKKVAAKKKK